MNEGWAKPHGARKWHYFVDNASLCDGWEIWFDSTLRDPESKPTHPDDDCVVCTRKREKLS